MNRIFVLRQMVTKTFSFGISLGLCFYSIVSCKKEVSPITTSSNTALQNLVSHYHLQLDSILYLIEKQPTDNLDSLKVLFPKIRFAFKKAEPVMAFIDPATYHHLNQPNLLKVDETDNAQTISKPTGFQVLEEILYSNDSVDSEEAHRHLQNIYHRLQWHKKTKENLSFLQSYHILWMLRDSFTRIMAFGITGFDSPILQNSLPENQHVLQSMQENLLLVKPLFNDTTLYKTFSNQLKKAKVFLSNKDFESFDRYTFIRDHLHPLLRTWKATATDWHVLFPFKQPISYEAVSYFSPNTFEIEKFTPVTASPVSPEKIHLGEKLFYMTILSKDQKMSCASCHDPSLAFTDGLPRSKSNRGTFVKRNAPTLLYAGLQKSQFYDARVTHLENQILDVVRNENEFHTQPEKMMEIVQKDSVLIKEFNALYPQDPANPNNIQNAIAHFVRSLHPFDSKFDQNISGLQETLTDHEIKGFNLFMGKAACATCHFPPLFNGTLPPQFHDSELEVLGVPEKVQWTNATIDNDLGRYDLHQAELKKYAFKTPTIRNISKTAPYMHNGIYTSLEDVIEFYNIGGGAGIGILLDNQTLPPTPLELTDKEKQDLIAFLNTLNDSIH